MDYYVIHHGLQVTSAFTICFRVHTSETNSQRSDRRELQLIKELQRNPGEQDVSNSSYHQRQTSVRKKKNVNSSNFKKLLRGLNV